MKRALVVPCLLALLLAPGPGWLQARQDAPPAEPPGTEAAVPEAGEEALLGLQDVLEAALRNNLQILVRSYEPERAAALEMSARAAFDPSITGTGGTRESQDPRPSSFLKSLSSDFYSVVFQDPLTYGARYQVNVDASESRTVTLFDPAGVDEVNTSWQFSYVQPLLRNLGRAANRWRILVAQNGVQAGESRYRSQVLQTLGDAEKAYWDLHFAIMDLRTQRASLQLAKDFLEQNRIKVRVGTLAPIEITQAEAGVADREEGVILAENNVQVAEDALRQIMNVPADSPLWSRPLRPGDMPPLTETVPDMEAAVTAAAANRPDLEQARLEVRNREYEMVYRRNQRRWGLDLEGIYGNTGFDPLSYGDAFDDLRERNQEDWTVSLTLGVPIGNRQARAMYRETDALLAQARHELERLEQAARVEVRNAVRTVETNLKRVRAAQVNVRLQREKLAAEQKKFENGMSTSFQVLQFQTDLSSAESRENRAIVDYNKSLVDLERAKGTLIEARGMMMPAPRAGGPDGGARAAFGGVPDGAIDPVDLPAAFVFDGRRIHALSAPPR
jgi:outer membrane protein TolC